MDYVLGPMDSSENWSQTKRTTSKEDIESVLLTADELWKDESTKDEARNLSVCATAVIPSAQKDIYIFEMTIKGLQGRQCRGS